MNTLIVEVELKQLDHDCGPDCFCWRAVSDGEGAEANQQAQNVSKKKVRRSGSGTVVGFPKVS